MEHPDFDKYDTTSLKSIGGGGAPTPASQVKKTAKKFKGGSPGQGYGLTETSPIIVTEKYGPTEFTQGGLQEAPGVQVRSIFFFSCSSKHLIQKRIRSQVYICEQNSSKVLPLETEGEICVVGPNVMIGYHNREEETREVIFDLEGQRAFRTGDMGVLSSDRTLTITGRCKELYKLRNGKYVVPTQIEERISLSRFISQCMLFGADRDYNVCLLSLDDDATKDMNDNDLEDLIQNELDSLNHGGYDWPQKFKIVRLYVSV